MLSAQAHPCLVQSSPARSSSPGKCSPALHGGSGAVPWIISMGKAHFPLYLEFLSHPIWHWDTSHEGESRGSNPNLRPSWEEFVQIPGKVWESSKPQSVATWVWSQVCDASTPGVCSTQLKQGSIPSQIPRGFLVINHKSVPAPLS